MAEGFGGVVIVHLIKDAGRRDPDADTVGTPNLNDGLSDFESETTTIRNGPTVGVGSMIGATTQELVEKIPIGVMNLHAIEASFLGEFGPVDVFGNNPRELGDCQSTRGDIIHHLFSGKDLSFGSDGGGCDR